ncbi:BppU family phage baseplate upper protein [Enterococcus thailandicus]|uniref:BppU family phage baseplate upper protein n=1 Tax=Enterococcus thailandicus TaxID=417368 RepID=UPI0034DCDD8D
MVYKLNESLIKIQAEAINPIQTNVVFWSHDRSTAKLRFKLMKNGVAQSLPEGTIVPIRLKFRSGTAEGGYGSHDYLATIEDRVNGIVSIVIKDNLLGYIGKIEGSIYIEFPNDQSLDTAGRFIFDIKRSPIDATTQEVDDYYFEGFEEVIDRLEAIKAEMDALDYKSFQKHKLTADNGLSMRLSDIVPRPTHIDDITRVGTYYITSAESVQIIPEGNYLRDIAMTGAMTLYVYGGDTVGMVNQEIRRNISTINGSRIVWRRQASGNPNVWDDWNEIADVTQTMLSNRYYKGAAHKLAEATITGKQATSYLELSENTGIYYLTTNESKAMSDFTQLPPEFIYGVFVENIPNATINNFLQRITSNVTDGVSQPPVTYWRVIQKKADGYTPTKWRKVVSQDDAQMYKLTKDNGQSFRLEDLNPEPTSLEDWARKFKGFFYIPNSSLKTMTDFSTLPASFASSHVHMLIQAGAGFDYALQTITQYQAPYRQLYRVVTNTAVLPWQSVANLAEVVNTTEPQSIGGVKNFLETPTVKGVSVLTDNELPFEAWYVQAVSIKKIADKGRLPVGREATTIGKKYGRKMKSNPLKWNSDQTKAEVLRDCKLFVEGVAVLELGGSAGKWVYIDVWNNEEQTQYIGTGYGVGAATEGTLWYRHNVAFSRYMEIKAGTQISLGLSMESGKELISGQIIHFHVMEII